MTSNQPNIKFPDDTKVVGLITKENNTANREEVQKPGDWSASNNLALNISKTKESYNRATHAPLQINDEQVDQVESFKLLGVSTPPVPAGDILC